MQYQKEVLFSGRKPNRKKIIIILIFLIIIIFLFYIYFKIFQYNLDFGAEIKNVLISEDGQTAYLRLEGGSANQNITKIKFIFYDESEKEYYYETTKGAKEFSLFFEKSWFIFTKPNYEGMYDYEINANEIRLESFRNIKRIEIFFEYETNSGEIMITLPLDAEEQIYDENNKEFSEEEIRFKTCTSYAECSETGIFCSENKVYNCNYGKGGCLDKTNETQCRSGEECINGSGCMNLAECKNNNDCGYLNSLCGYGICTSSKCELIFNSSTNVCRQANGECDVGEYCTGTSTSCPNNLFKNSGTACSIGICDGNNNCLKDVCHNVVCLDYLNQSDCENNLCLSCEWNLNLGVCKNLSIPTTNQLSQFGITWTFDKEYNYGKFANGDYWVVGPVKIININPISEDDGTGRIVHGSMINPSPKNGVVQGYDNELYGSFNKLEYYDAKLNAARPNNQKVSINNPLIVQQGSSLVSTISTLDASGRTQLQTAAILTVLNAVAPKDSFRPPYVNISKDIKFNKNQLNYSLLKTLMITPEIRNVMPRLHQQSDDKRTLYMADSVERMFERPWLDHVPGWMGRSSHPFDNMDDYDRDISNEEGIAVLMLHLDFSNEPDFISYGSNKAYKETLLIRFVQVGIDNFGIIQDGGREVWLQDSGRKFPILFAGLMLNNQDMKDIGKKSGVYAHTYPYGLNNPPPDLIRFEEDEMIFYVNQADVDLTQGNEWNPDPRSAQKIPYEVKDIGLPEWGIVRLYDKTSINKYWETVYRPVISPAYGGFALAIHIMGVKDLWNNNAFLDYKDRFMEVETANREHIKFTENMWDTYRQNYGCVWTRENPSDTYSQGRNSCEDGLASINPWKKISKWFKDIFG
jgi:hypothetical protein